MSNIREETSKMIEEMELADRRADEAATDALRSALPHLAHVAATFDAIRDGAALVLVRPRAAGDRARDMCRRNALRDAKKCREHIDTIVAALTGEDDESEEP